MWVTPEAKLLQGFVWNVSPVNKQSIELPCEFLNADIVEPTVLFEFFDGSFAILTDASEVRPKASKGWYVRPCVIDEDIAWNERSQVCRLIKVFHTEDSEEGDGEPISMALFAYYDGRH